MMLSVLQLANAYGMDFFETSAFTNHNITEVCFKEFMTFQNKSDWLGFSPCSPVLVFPS